MAGSPGLSSSGITVNNPSACDRQAHVEHNILTITIIIRVINFGRPNRTEDIVPSDHVPNRCCAKTISAARITRLKINMRNSPSTRLIEY